MGTSIPVVVTRDGPDITAEVNGQSIKMICDTAKWECRFGLADSGTIVRVTFKPKSHSPALKKNTFARQTHK